MPLVTALVFLGTLALLAPSVYLLFLTLAGLLYRPPAKTEQEPQYRFAILVPAHNEENSLPRLLRSLLKASYP